MPRRESLLVSEMVEAGSRAMELVRGRTVQDLAADRDLRDALLWNFTVLGEAAMAAGQLPGFVDQLRAVANQLVEPTDA